MSPKKLVSFEEILRVADSVRGEGKKVGYTSGVFDLLHAGHIEYLEQAKSECDWLIVGVNSDSSVRSYKDPQRPIISEDQRAAIVAGLEAVDHVFIFSDTNNNSIITQLRPDLYFKAGDYKVENLSSAPIVAAYGGGVKILPFKAGHSTSSIIDTILTRYGGVLAHESPGPRREFLPAVFLDRDGTINEHVEYLHEPEKFKLLPGVIEGSKKLSEAGFRLIVVTNQPGIGLGYFTKEQFYKVNKELLKAFSSAGILIDKVYYSPYAKADNTECRKPKIGMVQRAVSELNIDLGNSFVVGDTTTDMQLARNAGCKAVLVETGYGGKDKLYDVKPDYVAPSFIDATDWILSQKSSIESRSPGASNSDEKPTKVASSAQENESLQAIGRVTAKLGHDFNNLLGSIRGCVDLIRHKAKKLQLEGQPFDRSLDLIDRSLHKALDLTQKIRGYARPEPLHRDEVSLGSCLKSLNEVLGNESNLPCEVHLIVTEDSVVQINQFQVTQMLMSICLNAIEAMGALEERHLVIGLGKITLPEGEGGDLGAGDYAQVTIMDHGIGISKEVRDRVFEPFFSTKADSIGGGSGLGLSMAQEIMRQHGGQLSLRSIPDCGTIVHIYFPVVEESKAEI